MGFYGPLGPGGFRRRGRRRGFIVGTMAGAAMAGGNDEPTTVVQTSGGSSELEALLKLRDQGIITNEEFEARKNQLI
jgi:hypothetical protein